jgi:predicted DNA-binding protein YlxM (UPF0122 family)
MTNKSNITLAELSRKRRAMYYKLHILKDISCADLARKYGVSRQRMSILLKLAKEDLK